MLTDQAIIFILTAVPLTLFSFAVLTYLQDFDHRMKAGNEHMDEYDLIRQKSIWGRALPLSNLLLQLQRTIPGLGALIEKQGKAYESTLHQANKPGNLTGAQFFAFKELCALIGFLIIALVAPQEPILLIIIPIVGFFLPDLSLKQTIQNTKVQILRELPDALDTLGLMVSASQGFNQAVGIYLKQSESSSAVDRNIRVYKHHTAQSSSLGDQFALYEREMQLGISSNEALRNMSERVQCGPLTDFVLTTIQAQKTGTPLSETLKEQADSLRSKRFQEADMAGQKAVVKLLFPLMLFILPCCFLVLFGPLLVRYIGG